MNVCSNAEKIAHHLKLSDTNINVLKISALFHDVGFIETYDGHEEVGYRYAKAFLNERGID